MFTKNIKNCFYTYITCRLLRLPNTRHTDIHTEGDFEFSAFLITKQFLATFET